MIKRTQLLEAGRFNKPHGVKGEISATLTIDADLSKVKCIVMELDGLFVPFFITGFRPKTHETSLVSIDGVDSEEKVRKFVNHPFYLLREDPALASENETEDDEDGVYASDLIGCKVIDSVFGELGEIIDVNDSTTNVLFVVKMPSGEELLIPVAEEFIDSVDIDAGIVAATIPEEIINLNSRQS